MFRALIIIVGCLLILLVGVRLVNPSIIHISPKPYAAASSESNEHKKELIRLKSFAKTLKAFAKRNDYSTSTCFFVDMQLHSGKNRFFVYDLKKDSLKYAGLVAHGSCNKTFLAEAKFSNTPNCGCSSPGMYAISYPYKGRFGTAFKLKGLDATNSNAFKRFIVLHGYSCVPDNETYPLPICNSLGCPMVSYKFLDKLAVEIKGSNKPIVLWMLK